MTSSATFAAALTTGPPANVEPWSPGANTSLQLRADDERTDRQAAAEALGQRHRVRHDAELLVRPQRAGPPHAGLDLVEHQRGADRVARRADRRPAARPTSRSRPTRPGSARSARRRCSRRPRPRPPSASTARKPGHQRRERRLLGLLRRRAQRAVRAPVERVHGRRRRRRAGGALRTSLIAASLASAPGVAEEHDSRRTSASHSRAASVTFGVVVEQVRDVHQPRRPAPAPPPPPPGGSGRGC